MHVSLTRVLLSTLVAISTIVVIVAVAIALFLNPLWVGFEQDRTGAAGLTGFTSEQVHDVTGGILRDLVIGPPAFDQVVDGAPVLNDRERSHLVDVRGVFIAFGGLALLGALTLVNARIASHGAGWFLRSVGAGATILTALVLVGGVIVAVAFDQAFEVFHRLFFAGGTYTFDPRTDRLVQLFPDAFWAETSIAVGVAILAICTVVARRELRSRPGA
jgi:integral membrane protein (TIGR01906 family)